jgi:hypothetical protein
MTDVTSAAAGRKLRPEDATTLEEFQARRDAELARIGAPGASWTHAFTIMLTIAVAAIDVFYWHRFSQASGGERWHVLALALLFLCATVSVGGKVLLSGPKRRRGELERLSAQWQERADRGEVARTTLTMLAPVLNLTRIDGPAAPVPPVPPSAPTTRPDTPEAR